MIRDAFVLPVAQATPACLTIASGTQIDDCPRFRFSGAPLKPQPSKRQSSSREFAGREKSRPLSQSSVLAGSNSVTDEPTRQALTSRGIPSVSRSGGGATLDGAMRPVPIGRRSDNRPVEPPYPDCQ